MNGEAAGSRISGCTRHTAVSHMTRRSLWLDQAVGSFDHIAGEELGYERRVIAAIFDVLDRLGS